MRNQQSIFFKPKSSSKHDNFQELVEASAIFDCRHVIEWESIQKFGHSDFSKLTIEQQKWLYNRSKDKVVNEAIRAENSLALRRYLS